MVFVVKWDLHPSTGYIGWGVVTTSRESFLWDMDHITIFPLRTKRVEGIVISSVQCLASSCDLLDYLGFHMPYECLGNTDHILRH